MELLKRSNQFNFVQIFEQPHIFDLHMLEELIGRVYQILEGDAFSRFVLQSHAVGVGNNHAN